MPYMTQIQKHKKGLFYIVLAFIVSMDLIGTYFFFRHAENAFLKSIQTAYDAAVLFWADNASLEKESLRRILHVKSLYDSGLISHIICVGGSRPQKNFCGSQAMRQELARLGVPPRRIMEECRSYDSIGNWQQALRLITRHHFHRVVLVSNSLHLLRLRRIVENRPNDLQIGYAPYPFESAKPPVCFPEIYFKVHREWLAYAFYTLLPTAAYRYLVSSIRQSL